MPLVFLVLSACLNVVLDLILIINFKMGVAGAAWATNLSQAISAVLCAVYIGPDAGKAPLAIPQGRYPLSAGYGDSHGAAVCHYLLGNHGDAVSD